LTSPRETCRDDKRAGLPWEIAKGFDNSAAIGTFVPKSDFEDLSNLNFHLDINGKRFNKVTRAI